MGRLLRFRLRTLMIGIGLTGLALGVFAGAAAERRRAYYRQRVETLAWGEADVIEQIARELRTIREARSRGEEGLAELDKALARASQLAEIAAWHVKLERHYAWAADHPWSKLPPDPPPPGTGPE